MLRGKARHMAPAWCWDAAASRPYLSPSPVPEARHIPWVETYQQRIGPRVPHLRMVFRQVHGPCQMGVPTPNVAPVLSECSPTVFACYSR